MLNPWKTGPSQLTSSDLFGLCDHFFGDTLSSPLRASSHCFYQAPACHFETPPSTNSIKNLYETTLFRDMWPSSPYMSQENRFVASASSSPFSSDFIKASREKAKPDPTTSEDTETVVPNTFFEASIRALHVDSVAESGRAIDVFKNYVVGGFRHPCVAEEQSRSLQASRTRKNSSSLSRKRRASAVSTSECALPYNSLCGFSQAGLRGGSCNAGTNKPSTKAGKKVRKPLSKLTQNKAKVRSEMKRRKLNGEEGVPRMPPPSEEATSSTVVTLTVAKRPDSAVAAVFAGSAGKHEANRQPSKWTKKNCTSDKARIKKKRKMFDAPVINYVTDENGRPVTREFYGCWTCRLRHVSCAANGPPCSGCRLLGHECDMAPTRPSYIRSAKERAQRLSELQNMRRTQLVDKQGN